MTGDPGAGQVTLRPIEPGDEPFLRALYGTTRADELALVDWTDAQKAEFVRMQFQAQHEYYQAVYAGARFDVILIDGQPAGRLYVARHEGDIRIVDIALMPTYRGQGIGTRFLRAIQAEAANAGKTVSVHVEIYNPARTLYERLGFQYVEDKGVYLLMRWTPEDK